VKHHEKSKRQVERQTEADKDRRINTDRPRKAETGIRIFLKDFITAQPAMFRLI
jgi:hypothetical protein